MHTARGNRRACNGGAQQSLRATWLATEAADEGRTVRFTEAARWELLYSILTGGERVMGVGIRTANVAEALLPVLVYSTPGFGG